MRRIRSYTTRLAALFVLCLSAQSATLAVTAGAAGNPAVDRQVQEAIAKARAQQAGGGSASSSGGSESGGGSAFSKLTEKGSEAETSAKTTTTASRKTTESSSGGLSAAVLLPIGLVAAGLLATIAFLILRDARGVTPAGELLPVGNAEARAARLRKRRAKAKAAKQQRKRNR